MRVIVSVLNLTSFGYVITQSTGLGLATKSVVRANEAMAAARSSGFLKIKDVCI